jgi:hypothetical protein
MSGRGTRGDVRRGGGGREARGHAWHLQRRPSQPTRQAERGRDFRGGVDGGKRHPLRVGRPARPSGRTTVLCDNGGARRRGAVRGGGGRVPLAQLSRGRKRSAGAGLRRGAATEVAATTARSPPARTASAAWVQAERTRAAACPERMNSPLEQHEVRLRGVRRRLRRGPRAPGGPPGRSKPRSWTRQRPRVGAYRFRAADSSAQADRVAGTRPRTPATSAVCR